MALKRMMQIESWKSSNALYILASLSWILKEYPGQHNGSAPPPSVAMPGLITGGEVQSLPFLARQSEEESEGGQVDTGARSSHEPPHPEVVLHLGV